jgi:hypothetical protein
MTEKLLAGIVHYFFHCANLAFHRDQFVIWPNSRKSERRGRSLVSRLRLISDPKPDRWLFELLGSSYHRQSGGEREASKPSRKCAAIDIHAAASYFETAAERPDVRTILADWPAQIGPTVCLVARKSKA